MIEYIESTNAPEAIGPYSQAVTCNGLLYTSGQIAIDPQTQTFISGGIKEQTELVINNIGAILKASHSSFDMVIKVTIYLSNLEHFAEVNKIYSDYFTSRPARSTVEVSKLPKDALIEIDCIAEIKLR